MVSENRSNPGCLNVPYLDYFTLRARIFKRFVMKLN